MSAENNTGARRVPSRRAPKRATARSPARRPMAGPGCSSVASRPIEYQWSRCMSLPSCATSAQLSEWLVLG